MTEIVDLEQEVTYLTRPELAARLRLTENVLAHWPARGYGPRARKFGGRIRYKMSDVLAWENSQEQGGAA